MKDILKPRSNIFGLCFLFSSLIFLSACSDSDQNNQKKFIPVDVYTVQTMNVPIVSHLTGRASATRLAEVRPQVSGVIQKRLFTEGSEIKQGDQLYQIDPALYQANVESAKATLASAKANLNVTQLKAQRYAKLLKTNSVSKQDYDDANAAYLQAKAQVEQAQAQLTTANINLAYTKVYAPISGRISKSNFTEGALVSAQQTDPLATIQQLDPMYIDLGQSVEQHINIMQALKNGSFKKDKSTTVDLYLSNGEKYPIQGKLEFSEVTVDESTSTVNMRVIVDNPDNLLLPGMFIRADINQGYLPNAPVVDQSAVIREAGGATYVYTVSAQGTAQRTNIVLGPEVDKYFMVSSGLKVGDKVIASNIQKVRVGVPVVDIKTLQQKQAQ